MIPFWKRKKVAAQVTEALINGTGVTRLCKTCVHRDASGGYGWECQATQVRVLNVVTGDWDLKGGTPSCTDRRRDGNLDCGPEGKLWVKQTNTWKRWPTEVRVLLIIGGCVAASVGGTAFMQWWWGYL